MNAALPAATALSTSCGVEIGTSRFAFLVAGLIPWRVLEVGTSFPLITLWNVVKSILPVPLALSVVLVAEGAIFEGLNG